MASAGSSPSNTADSFESMPLSQPLLRSIREYGFAEPSCIQKQALPLCLNGRNVFVQSQSGTGKMSMAAIAVLQSVTASDSASANDDASIRRVQALVLTPTREMALAVRYFFGSIGKAMGVRCCACVGGIQMRDHKSELDAGVDIVIGTPGRVQDLIKRGWLSTAQIRLLALTETDELLARGFKDHLTDLFCAMPEGWQTLIFSPTAPVELHQLLNSLSPSPVHIQLDRNNFAPSLSDIRQFYIDVQSEDFKRETLGDLFNCLPSSCLKRPIIFCSAIDLAKRLAADDGNFLSSVGSLLLLHGELDNEEQDRIVQQFLSSAADEAGENRLMLLVAMEKYRPVQRMDLLQRASIVINYDLPQSLDGYMERLGRTGSSGHRSLIAVSLVTTQEHRMLQELMNFYSTLIEEMPQDISCLL